MYRKMDTKYTLYPVGMATVLPLPGDAAQTPGLHNGLQGVCSRKATITPASKMAPASVRLQFNFFHPWTAARRRAGKVVSHWLPCRLSAVELESATARPSQRKDAIYLRAPSLDAAHQFTSSPGMPWEAVPGLAGRGYSVPFRADEPEFYRVPGAYFLRNHK